jgi:hypothetical protein
VVKHAWRLWTNCGLRRRLLTWRENKKEHTCLISLELKKKRLSTEDKRAESDLIKEEKEIMTVDMSSLTPLQQQYYVTMQEKIITRHLANQI